MTTGEHDESAERARRLAELLQTMAAVLSDFNEHLQAAEADAPRRQALLRTFGEFMDHAAPTLREAASLLHGARIIDGAEPDNGMPD